MGLWGLGAEGFREGFGFRAYGLRFEAFGLSRSARENLQVSALWVLHLLRAGFNVGALIIRIGFGGISYCNYNKEPPNPILIIKAPPLGTSSTLLLYFILPTIVAA